MASHQVSPVEPLLPLLSLLVACTKKKIIRFLRSSFFLLRKVAKGMQGRTRWERSACSVMGAVLYISFLLFQLGQAIPFDPERDNDVNGFFVAPSEPSGREQVSMVNELRRGHFFSSNDYR